MAIISGCMPEILFINPPVYDFALFDLFLKPYGLMRIAAWFRSAGYRIRFINGLDFDDELSDKELGKPRRRNNGTGKFYKEQLVLPDHLESPGRQYFRYGISLNSFRKKMIASQPELILITSGMTYWYPGVREAVALCREIHPGVPVIVGGIYASLLPEHCSTICKPDYCVQGQALPELFSILDQTGLASPFAVAEQAEDSGYFSSSDSHNQGRSNVAEIPKTPLFLPEIWNGAGVLKLNEGCPCHCDYCASSVLCPNFLPGSTEALYNRFHELYSQGIRNFAFYDDALLFNKEEGIYPFLEKVLIKNHKVNFYLPNAVHASELDAQCAELLFRSGFREIRLGYESDVDDFHQRHGAGKSERRIFTQAIDNLQKAGYDGSRIIAYALAGLPGQTSTEVEQAAGFASSLNIRVSLSEFSPVPQTELWQKAVEFSRYALEDEPVYHSNNYFSCEWKGFTREEMQKLRRAVWIANRQLLG